MKKKKKTKQMETLEWKPLKVMSSMVGQRLEPTLTKHKARGLGDRSEENIKKHTDTEKI